MATRTDTHRKMGRLPLVALGIIALVLTGSIDASPGLVLPEGEWSAVVDGVRGRLAVIPRMLNEKPQVQIDLELENVSTLGTPIEIPWTDVRSLLQLSLEDENGVAAAGDIKPAGNHMTPLPFWLQLPYESSMRFTISSGAYQYFPDGRVWLRPLPFSAWIMTENRGRKLYLRGKLVPNKSTENGHTPWKGPLDLPRVALQ
jgi:hypothetical protein